MAARGRAAASRRVKLQLFKPLWGHTGTIAQAATQARLAGFDGIEGPIPADPAERIVFTETLQSHSLFYIAEISATGFANPDPAATVDDQLDTFQRLLALSLEANPLFCTTMSGNDLWTFAQSLDFLTRAHQIALRHHARVAFETHRSRTLFHPIITRDLLRELPHMELTIDFSHWCVVTERLVMDLLPDILDLCSRHVLHIHARIGYDQGPQVPDPRAPEYAPAVDAHLRWWRALWTGQRHRAFNTVTMTPEFGPDGYLHLQPHTQKPVADLWDLNTWTAHLLRREFHTFLNNPT
jgi:sugar phosphate isomerase/epimerase